MKIPFGSGSLENLWGKAKSAFTGTSGPISLEKPQAIIQTPSSQAPMTTPLDQRFLEAVGAMPQGTAAEQVSLVTEVPSPTPASQPSPPNSPRPQISASAPAVSSTPIQPKQAISNFITQIQTEEIADIEQGKNLLNTLAETPHFQAVSGKRIEASLQELKLNDQQVLLDELKLAMKASAIPIPDNFNLNQVSRVFKNLTEPQLRNLLHTLSSRDKRMEAEIERLKTMGDQFGSEAFKIADLEKARKMLGPLLKTELPQVLKIKQDYLKFESQLTTQRNALVENMRKFARENGLNIPESLLKTMSESPFGADFHLNQWLDSQRTQWAGQPDKLQALNSLKLFGIQLQNVSEILSRVQHRENISSDTLNKYVMFQTFITVKDKLFAAYENSSGPQREKLREAIFNLDQLFAGLEPTPEAFKARLESWLGQYLSPQEIAIALQNMGENIAQIEQHNDRVTAAESQGIRTPDNPPSLPPVPTSQPSAAEQWALLREITQAQTAYYRQVYAERGDTGLSEVLRREQETVLKPLADAGQLHTHNSSPSPSTRPKISSAVQEALKNQQATLLKKLSAGNGDEKAQQHFDKIRHALRQMLHKNQMEFRTMQQKLTLQKMLAEMMMQVQAELKHQDQNFQAEVRKHTEALLLEMQSEIQRIPAGTGVIQL